MAESEVSLIEAVCTTFANFRKLCIDLNRNQKLAEEIEYRFSVMSLNFIASRMMLAPVSNRMIKTFFSVSVGW